MELDEIKVKRLNRQTVVIIKLPNSLVLRVVSRSLFLTMLILALPFIGSIMRESSASLSDSEATVPDPTRFSYLPLLFRDLADEGLLRKGDKALLVGSEAGVFTDFSKYLTDYDIDLAFESDPDGSNFFPDAAFDLVLALDSRADESADRLLKTGGLLVLKQSTDPSNAFHQKHSNYKMVYLRRFNSTVLGMRKTFSNEETLSFPRKLKKCGNLRKPALIGLEDVLLEPPTRRASDYMKRTKFLPDLVGDSLESYPRRIFITDDNADNGGVVEWFQKNYPMRDQNFEVYNLEKEANGVSEWIRRNVMEDDFVVMKAEAEVVEEMVRERSICMVDELFLECANEWEGSDRGKRTYWECLALYGKVRDDGIAVHQWWG